MLTLPNIYKIGANALKLVIKRTLRRVPTPNEQWRKRSRNKNPIFPHEVKITSIHNRTKYEAERHDVNINFSSISHIEDMCNHPSVMVIAA